MTQRRHVLIEEENGGNDCGVMKQDKVCNEQPCTKQVTDKWNSDVSVARRACEDATEKEREQQQAEGRAKTRLALTKDKLAEQQDALIEALPGTHGPAASRQLELRHVSKTVQRAQAHRTLTYRCKEH